MRNGGSENQYRARQAVAQYYRVHHLQHDGHGDRESCQGGSRRHDVVGTAIRPTSPERGRQQPRRTLRHQQGRKAEHLRVRRSLYQYHQIGYGECGADK